MMNAFTTSTDTSNGISGADEYRISQQRQEDKKRSTHNLNTVSSLNSISAPRVSHFLNMLSKLSSSSPIVAPVTINSLFVNAEERSRCLIRWRISVMEVTVALDVGGWWGVDHSWMYH
jgi:hypothetical protein